MTPGLYYVWPGCYAVHRKTKKPTAMLVVFLYQENGKLWPEPIGSGTYQNVSKMPEGDGVPWSYWQEKHKAAKEN